MCSHAFDLIHCDIWGPFHTPTHSSHRYVLCVVDDHTRFTWLHLLRAKSEASQVLRHFISWVQTQFGVTGKCLRSNNALELRLTDFLAQRGIEHQFSCVECPQ